MGALFSREFLLLLITGGALVLIISNRLRPDLVALLVLVALGLTRILSPAEALAGFSSAAVITIAGVFVITAALERTGVAAWIAAPLARLSGGGETRLILVFMTAGAVLSLAMNNIAAGAVLLPAAVSVARRSGVRESRVLIPLAFGTLLGGMATLFTTANIIVSGSLQAQGQRALTLLDFLPAGAAMFAAGLLYMRFVGRRLLPERESMSRSALARPDLTETYQLAERLWEVRVQPASPLVGQRLAEAVIGSRLGVTVIAVWHGTEARVAPAPSERIAAGDALLVLGREERVRQLELEGCTIGRDADLERRLRTKTLSVRLTEVVIAPRSPAIGQTLKELRFRSKFGLTTVALWREGRSYRTDVGDFPLQAGDALLMVGSPEEVRVLAQEPGYIVLDLPSEAPPLHPGKARWAALITGGVLVLSAIGAVPTAEAMLAGAAALILTGCLGMEESYRAIEWKALLLVAGMLPIGTALADTGLGVSIARSFTSWLAPVGAVGVIAALYLFAVVLTQLVGGQVAALIAGPIAVSAALQLGVSAPAVAVAVAMGCSAAFLTPIAHPVNILIMGPGGYTFRDFFRVGLGMALTCFLTLLAVMPLLLRL